MVVDGMKNLCAMQGGKHAGNTVDSLGTNEHGVVCMPGKQADLCVSTMNQK